ncbi:hypothetical protein PHET_08097 [Paragonimus heterotremus]|uniref:Charged multivesicular body protein 2B n=1 Tax=Paragonimus heterotremus TaxID=100268 RepID=A0A8J4SMH1_9TREM|nr:hypothetical protein PHET_08097 [Paragonimus heterotremus]
MSHKNTGSKQLRENERLMRSAKRDLTRDQQELRKEESRLETEIKRLAAKGDKKGCAILAKQLIELRKQVTRNMTVQSNLTSVSSGQRIAASTMTMGKVIGSATGVMKEMNKNMDHTNMGKTLQDFSKLQLEIGMKEEAMDDILDSADFEDETDEVVNRVLDELNIDTKTQLDKARVPSDFPPAVDTSENVDDLEAQLRRLRE